MYPGFSGGPLVNADEHLLGINTSALIGGLSLTIPTATIRRTVETLLKHGRIKQGYLGLGGQPVRLPKAQQAQVGQETGLLLMMVEPGGPADQGGLLLGDILLSLDGQILNRMEDLLGLLNGNGERAGATVPIRFLRAGQPREGHVTIGERS
jgi:S1-C subfamily serine protease